MNEQREAFEAERFGEKVPGVTTPKFDPDTGYYYGSSNQAAWEGFQMAWECTKARAERFDAMAEGYAKAKGEASRLRECLDAVVKYLEVEYSLYDDSDLTGLYTGGFVRKTLSEAIEITKGW